MAWHLPRLRRSAPDDGTYTLVGLGYMAMATIRGTIRIARGEVVRTDDRALALALVQSGMAAEVPKGVRPEDVLADADLEDD